MGLQITDPEGQGSALRPESDSRPGTSNLRPLGRIADFRPQTEFKSQTWCLGSLQLDNWLGPRHSSQSSLLDTKNRSVGFVAYDSAYRSVKPAKWWKLLGFIAASPQHPDMTNRAFRDLNVLGYATKLSDAQQNPVQ
ncbi:hypothetical protein ON010_g4434 [Phytophthora cinnamomi]|nr:hypothetical protein ON010_g4434 [Phytophthora cinnamomi]